MKTNPEMDIVDAVQLVKASLNLRILNHPLRLQFLNYLHQEGRVVVTAVHKKFRIEQSVASQHLSLLRAANLVLTKRKGRNIYYSVNYEELKRWHECFKIIL